jgi:hypothetical protein
VALPMLSEPTAIYASTLSPPASWVKSHNRTLGAIAWSATKSPAAGKLRRFAA